MRDDYTDVWAKYLRSKQWHDSHSIQEDTESCYDFFEGRQWVQDGVDHRDYPVMNFIAPVVKYKVASVAMNDMDIVYSAMNTEEEFKQTANDVCDKLNRYAAQLWELRKMHTKMWDMNEAAAISGDAYLYFYDTDSNCQMVDRTNVFLANENSSDIQKQPWLILKERRFVDEVRKEAKCDPEMIVADSDIETDINVDSEVSGSEMCTSLLMFFRKNGIVHYCRSTRTAMYEPETPINTKMYPVVSLVWNPKKGSSRGIGEVYPMIPNQREHNKTNARIAEAIKTASFPKLVYKADSVSDPTAFDVAGAKISISDLNVNRVSDIVSYLNPAPISADARNFADYLLQQTQTLAGAGDAALGNVNPEQASGTAILAVRDQSMIPLNQQIQRYDQLVEDIARVWYELWAAYNPNGLQVTYETDDGTMSETIPAEVLQQLNINIKIDVSSANPFSKYAQEQSITNLFTQQVITFEEFVSLLDGNSSLPKAKLEELIQAREQVAMEQMQGQQMQQEQMQEQQVQPQAQIDALNALV